MRARVRVRARAKSGLRARVRVRRGRRSTTLRCASGWPSGSRKTVTIRLRHGPLPPELEWHTCVRGRGRVRAQVRGKG